MLKCYCFELYPRWVPPINFLKVNKMFTEGQITNDWWVNVYVFDKIFAWLLFPWNHILRPPRGGGYSLIQSVQVCAAPTGRVFGPFWSENGYTLCPFWSGIEYGFRGNYGSAWRYWSFQFQMSKKEREICELEMDLHFFLFYTLI